MLIAVLNVYLERTIYKYLHFKSVLKVPRQSLFKILNITK